MHKKPLDNPFFLIDHLSSDSILPLLVRLDFTSNLVVCFLRIMPNRINNLKDVRESRMMSKAELARKANVSPITIARIESGMQCRMETKRKIILALGFKLSDKDKIFLS
jgi:DNA-binding XRE family transcriptional regulator